VDSGVRVGDEVSPYYDPLLAKIITWGETREEAVSTMVSALRDFVIEGITTNLPLLARVIAHPKFLGGEYHTGSLTQEFARPAVSK
jgi:acetyl/propionyl-CoA carboxylase alpha subunit